MKYALLPRETLDRPLPFYLAMEEYLAAMPCRDELFFMWQVRPTVIFGRNQRIESEVDVDYCKGHGIQFFRRKSGGGCVYADGDNIMFSAIIPRSAEVSAMFARYTQMVVDMLRSLGFDASASGRNDVLVGGRKVSGNAVYILPDKCIIHGTMLFDTNLQHMLSAISPSGAKLNARGISSVKSRITTLRSHMPELDISEFKRHVREAFCGDNQLRITPADVGAIYRLSLGYYHPSWIYGDSVSDTRSYERRLEGVGEFRVCVDTRLDRIGHIRLSGDYFVLDDVDTRLLRPLEGCRYTPEAVAERLTDSNVDASRVIMSLTNEAFASLLFE